MFDKERVQSRSECLTPLNEVLNKVALQAKQISDHYKGTSVTTWTVLNGALVYAGTLLPSLEMSVMVDYVHATRYVDNIPQSDIRWLAQPKQPIDGQHILILDDIFDAGETLAALTEYALSQGAASVKTAVMVYKKRHREKPVREPDFVALTVPDRYVFGMGMDYEGQLRNLPGIWALRNLDT